MDAIFMNSGNSKTSDSYRLLLRLSDQINLKRGDMFFYQIIVYTIHGKNIKNNK